MNKILNQKEVESLYKELGVAHNLAEIMSGGDIHLYTQMMSSAITTCVGSLGSSKVDDPLFDNDLFKEELTEGLHKCLENNEFVSQYGDLWFAHGSVLVDILDIISSVLMQKLVLQAQEDMQAKLN
tara:strand:+ start:11694 stop:12071 length:378 start_codon:yes stop_codon:yes gene_type:complete